MWGCGSRVWCAALALGTILVLAPLPTLGQQALTNSTLQVPYFEGRTSINVCTCEVRWLWEAGPGRNASCTMPMHVSSLSLS